MCNQVDKNILSVVSGWKELKAQTSKHYKASIEF